MGDQEGGWGWQPTGAPFYIQKDDHWRHFDNSVNAVSFGFVATAILISMFLVMAIFERFLRPISPALTPSGGRTHGGDIDSQIGFTGKLRLPSPKPCAKAKEVSVVMPGESMPTFIANPAPVPCPPERMKWPIQCQHYPFPNCIHNHNHNHNHNHDQNPSYNASSSSSVRG